MAAPLIVERSRQIPGSPRISKSGCLRPLEAVQSAFAKGGAAIIGGFHLRTRLSEEGLGQTPTSLFVPLLETNRYWHRRVSRCPQPLAAVKAKEDHGAPFQKLCRTLRAIQLDNVILTSRLGKKPGNLGKKVKNVIDSDLYSSRLTAINQRYTEVTGNM